MKNRLSKSFVRDLCVPYCQFNVASLLMQEKNTPSPSTSNRLFSCASFRRCFQYGKRGKEREDQQQPPTISFLGGVSAAQALSHNTNSTHASTSNRSTKSIRRSNLNIHPSTLFKKRSNDAISSSPSFSRSQTPLVTTTNVSSPLRKSITTDLVT